MRSRYRQNYRPGPPSGDFVYVIQGRDAVKIGVTRNLSERLAALQTGSPHELSLAYHMPVSGDAYAVEAEAHAMLERHRLSGEWFGVPADVAVAAINGAAFKMAPLQTVGEIKQDASWLKRIALIAITFAPAWACAAFPSPFPFLGFMLAAMMALVAGLVRVGRVQRIGLGEFGRWVGAIVLGLSASIVFGMIGFLVLKGQIS